MWCLETKKLAISRDVIFYETSMIQVLDLKDYSVKTMQRANKQVEFWTSLVPNSDYLSVPIASVPVQQYSIIRDRDIRIIKPPQI